MAINVYEGMFLLDSNRYARDPSGVSQQMGELIKKVGGELLVSRLWADQKLAYPIDGNKKGTYWLTYFRLDGPQVRALNREAQLNGNILRSLILAVEPRLVDTLVRHAQSGGAASDSPDASRSDKVDEPVKEPALTAADASGD